MLKRSRTLGVPCILDLDRSLQYTEHAIRNLRIIVIIKRNVLEDLDREIASHWGFTEISYKNDTTTPIRLRVAGNLVQIDFSLIPKR